ncbi:RNA-binding protein 45 [Amyelois transitella]|uniref:RNA-binding protein 45 n=1 Tax=Amyelois transitella TaxID=680683 RepID=UPI00067AFF8E|nr:RNA-binding protein 45 [Amyelois transitella]
MTAFKSNNWNSNMRNEERKEDMPPFSRVFVVCSKQFHVDDLRPHFEEFGEVEGIYMPRDRNTGESKGVAYIKYAKTSSAAAAIERLNTKTLTDSGKPLKVMVAANRNDVPSTNEEKYKRLFIKVHKEVKREEILEHFSTFGQVETVHIQKDKLTDACKGFAYVNFKSFLGAAKAYEGCDKKYRAVFATPKDELKRSRNSLDNIGPNFIDNYQHNNHHFWDNFHHVDVHQSHPPVTDMIKNDVPLAKAGPVYNSVLVTCSPQVPQKYIESLFNIIPGMVEFKYTLDSYNGLCKANITYESEAKASFAVERLNQFEFPSGEIISVKIDDPLKKAANNLTEVVNSFKNSIDSGNPDLLQLADAIAQASTLIKAATSVKNDVRAPSHDINCNVNLPAPQPMANGDSRVAQRCFIVCKPYPPPIAVLQDAFCRFGDLINVCTFPNKTFGFAKYASIQAAQEAIRVLNGSMLCGVQLKVCVADEKPKEDDHRMKTEDHSENHSDPDIDRKRMKLYDNSRSNNAQLSHS